MDFIALLQTSPFITLEANPIPFSHTPFCILYLSCLFSCGNVYLWFLCLPDTLVCLVVFKIYFLFSLLNNVLPCLPVKFLYFLLFCLSLLVIVCATKGSPRRCGGQGDILSGTMGVFNFWAHQISQAGHIKEWVGYFPYFNFHFVNDDLRLATLNPIFNMLQHPNFGIILYYWSCHKCMFFGHFISNAFCTEMLVCNIFFTS